MNKMKPKFQFETTVKALADQKRIECGVCGCKFTPMNDEACYVAKRPDGTLVDAFDCPQCGCQITVGERYEKVKATEGESWRKTNESSIGYVFENVRSFTRALEAIHDCMDDYKYITLTAFKNIVGESSTYMNDLVGWDNILDMKIEVDGNGYTLLMPPYNWEAK